MSGAKVLVLHRPGVGERVELVRPMTEHADTELLERVARGERDALGELFDRHARRLATFLHRLGHTRDHEIDDLVQDTFLAIARSAGEFQGGSSVRTWIFAVGANIARDRARGASRLHAMRRSLLRWLRAPEPRTPDHAFAIEEDLARARAAIAELPYEQRVAFVLCDCEEQPGVEVARSLGIPTGTLYRRLFEARKRLKAAMDEGVGRES